MFNLVIGEGDVGRAIVAHEDIDGISFTGSQVVGASVAEGAMKRQARVQLEMGGKNPLVVLDDADLDRAVMCAIDGAFFGTGQRCTASSRIIVTEGIHDRFVEALAEKARSLRVGDALDPQTQIGPAVSEQQLEQNLRYVGIARDEGGKVLTGGEPLTLGTRGYYMAPTVISDTAPDQRINCEEVFGPVASTVKVRDYEEALEIANRGQFGLSAGIVTNSLKHARHFRRNIRRRNGDDQPADRGRRLSRPVRGDTQVELRRARARLRRGRVLHTDQDGLYRGLSIWRRGTTAARSIQVCAARKCWSPAAARASARESSRRLRARAARSRSSTS